MQQRTDLLGECDIWTGACNDAGYPQVRLDGRAQYVHRLAYEQAKGPIPEGLHIDHLCRTPRCVNPDHLEPVTNAENVRRGIRAKITMADAERIRELAKTTSQQELARMFLIHSSQICRIINRKAWA